MVLEAVPARDLGDDARAGGKATLLQDFGTPLDPPRGPIGADEGGRGRRLARGRAR